MIAAIYARKSTDQTGVADDARSVTRQIEHARAYARCKGWTVLDEHVYTDDAISGAEFERRPGFVRLMATLKPRALFQVLVMSEESRLGREAIETAYALKQLVQAGVQLWFYLEDRQRTLDSPTDKIMLSLATYADELEREKARQRTYDAMQRKARAGHVTGGRVFGYDNVEVLGADGKRSHVDRRINEAEASVVRRIFEMSAGGSGLTGIAKALNVEGVPTPRPQCGRPAAWIASSVRAVLYRPLYRGEVVWNRTRKRNAWGQKHQAERPAGDWLHVESASLRIVSEDLWAAAHAQAERRRAQWASGDRSYRGSRYLLSGFARCALCGGGFSSHLRTHGTGARRFLARFYGCTSHWERGATVCTNGLVADMATIDAEVLATIKDDVLRPSIVERAIALALEELAPGREEAQRARLAADLAEVNDEHAIVMAAIARGGNVRTIVGLVERLQALEARRSELTSARSTRRAITSPAATDGLEQRLRAKLADWRGLLARNVESGREVLRTLLMGPLRFTPVLDGQRRGYRFTGAIALDRLVAGIVDLPLITRGGLASPAGFGSHGRPRVRGFSRARAA